VKGRKIHALVDTQGLPLRVVIHSAGVQDRDGAAIVLDKIRNSFPWFELVDWLLLPLSWNHARGFWVASFIPTPGEHSERTFRRISCCRQPVKDFGCRGRSRTQIAKVLIRP
jgi:transposase